MHGGDEASEQPRYRIALMGAPCVQVAAAARSDARWRPAPISTNPKAVELLALWILSRELIPDSLADAEDRGGVRVRIGREVTRDWLAACLFPQIFATDPQTARNQVANALRWLAEFRALPDMKERKRERRVVRLALEAAVDVLELRDAATRRLHEEVERLAEEPLLAGTDYPWMHRPVFQWLRAQCDVWYVGALCAAAQDIIARMERAETEGRPDNVALRTGATVRLEKAFRRLQSYGDLEGLQEEHPLRQLGRRISALVRRARIFELEAVEAPGALAKPVGLPAPAGSFIGRGVEKAEIRRLLEPGTLVTLVGTGGNGKTRLAIAIASDMCAEAGRFPDGAWFVDLAADHDPARVAHVVLAAVDGGRIPGDDPARSLVDLWRSRRVLLVLDNCEHLLMACSSLASTLLATCPGVAILATSREALQVPNEHAYSLPPLAYPDPERVNASQELRAGLIAYDAVRLFTDRARRSGAPFVLSGHEEAVARLSKRLEGNPLAIELVAARADVLSLQDMLKRLDRPFTLLRRDGSEMPARHQSMWNTIDWSFGLLSGAEHRLFTRLAVFEGTWTLDAAEAVCAEEAGGADLVDLLQGLTRKCLVQAELGSGDTCRFRLLELVRDYSLDRFLTTPEGPSVRSRHLQFYARFVETPDADLHGDAPERARQRLQDEWPNIRAALDFAVTSSAADAGAGLRLAAALGRFWYTRGHNRQASEWLTTLLAPCTDADGQVYAAGLRAAGNLALQRHDNEQARDLYLRCLRVEERLGNQQGIMNALGSLGNVARALGDLAAAQDFYARSLELSCSLRAHRVTSRTLDNLAALAVKRGDLPSAIQFHEQTVDILRRERDPEILVTALNNLAYTYRCAGEREKAVLLLGESLQACRQTRARHGLLHCLYLHFLLAVDLGNMETAAQLAGGEQAQRDALGIPRHPDAVPDYDAARDRAAQSLGLTPWQAMFDRGAALDLDLLVALAQNAFVDAPPSTRETLGAVRPKRDRAARSRQSS